MEQKNVAPNTGHARMKFGKLKTPLSRDQGRGAANHSPKNINENDILRSISSQGISAQMKIDIIKEAVARCPKVSIPSKGVQLPSLLVSSSEVSLICHSYFKEHLLPRIETPMGEKSDAHILFNLMGANDGQLPMKTYVELDITFLGLKVPNVGFLILEEPNRVLDKKHQTKLPGIIDWNLIWLTYKVLLKNMGEKNLIPLNIQQELIHSYFLSSAYNHYAEISKDHDYRVQPIYHQTD